MGRGNVWSVLVQMGTKEVATAIVDKHKDVLKRTQQERVGQIILSGFVCPFFRQEPRVHDFNEDDNQRTYSTAV